MYCLNVLKKLNEARIKGSLSITVESLSASEQEEIIECGYKIKKRGKKYVIYE